MKTLSFFALCIFAAAGVSQAQFSDIKETGAGTVFGRRSDKKIAFFGGTPIARPANTLTSRQALQALGLLASGGADPSDVFDLTTSNSLGDATNITLGGTTGTKIGTSATAEKLGFFNATPIVQPHAAAQGALTDSTTGGTADATLAAGTGVSTVTIPLTSLATGLSTSAIDLLTTYTPGYKFKLLGLSFVTTVAGTGSSASQVFNLAIGSTATTGGVLTLALADTDTIGKVKAATSITAANTGTASDTLSLKMAASGTVFTAGAGYFVVKIQNMDTADSFAKVAVLENALRTALVNLGLAKGAN